MITNLSVIFEFIPLKRLQANDLKHIIFTFADVVKLADTPDLGSGATSVQVQVLSSAPNTLYPCGTGLFYLKDAR